MLKTNHPEVVFNNRGVLIVAGTKTAILQLALEHMFGATLNEQLSIHPELIKHQLLDALSFYYEHEAALLTYINGHGLQILSDAKAVITRLGVIPRPLGGSNELHSIVHTNLTDSMEAIGHLSN
jgi:hypothetical protein